MSLNDFLRALRACRAQGGHRLRLIQRATRIAASAGTRRTRPLWPAARASLWCGRGAGRRCPPAYREARRVEPSRGSPGGEGRPDRAASRGSRSRARRRIESRAGAAGSGWTRNLSEPHPSLPLSPSDPVDAALLGSALFPTRSEAGSRWAGGELRPPVQFNSRHCRNPFFLI